ncbi:HAD family hydrolase [Sedimenticola selenatireducens]|uniref:HAD family hydrolase n=1 Tax=Sedimenticola selenatireducens TaxID=191960 RepID=A0A557S9V8_9GAMM|nr:HAD family hydrolase [Sedimenticola selenatireducens]TVO74212.1 HAD family hydrolase [Sedimenticola selenatireducens]TVT62541.1 MAG: HAD family hydrolase [Sedimenticola selenatireducens]
MLKALFLDLDETLCDTRKANNLAKALLAKSVGSVFDIEGDLFANGYLDGIYRLWRDDQRVRYLPIIQQQGEDAFRLQLIRDLLIEQGVATVSDDEAQALQDQFDRDRLEAFDYFPGILAFLAEARQLFTTVVITNGPEFSQIPKIEAVNLSAHVDHIIIGGQEPEEKPARSIFEKALRLANCEAHEAIHVGDSLAADIAGAQGSCITSVWVQHQQPLDAELGITPHHTVMHPSEIPALIRGLYRQ